MLKIFTIALFCVVGLSGGSVIHEQTDLSLETPYEALVKFEAQILSQWGNHILDFLQLIDLEKIVGVVLQYIHDHEVKTFIGFLLSPEFKKLVVEFESTEEFREAIDFLQSKGYNAESVVDLINAALGLPPFSKPQMMLKNKKGISGFIEAILSVLPIEDIKKLFEHKLEHSPEVGQIFEVINSEEFIDILQRLSKNPKVLEIKAVFEGYGFDFKHLCALAKQIFGKYYQGIFCE